MCGIAGFVDPHGTLEAPERVLQAMTGVLAHRGPDDEGHWTSPDRKVFLGHRRLAILDLSQEGHQPMSSADGSLTVVFNGEIYNHLELRRDLTSHGHRFRGTSDTETILAAISKWGLQPALSKFNGMFAFALWNHPDNTLTLARDRVGIKPLFWGRVGSLLCFTSEVRSLRAIPGFTRRVSQLALATYLQWNYLPAPLCIFEGIRKLRPATTLTIPLERIDEPAESCYWHLPTVAADNRQLLTTGNDQDIIDHLDTLLRDAVNTRMISDVPLGAFLSGGVDSSCIVAMMQSQSSRPVHTFSIGFEEREYDESRYARCVADHVGTDHTELTVTSQDSLDVVPELGGLFDEPFADSSQIPTLLVARLARQHVTVALSGDGGDELFFGYEHYAWKLKIAHRLQMIPMPARALMQRLLGSLPLPMLTTIAAALQRLKPQGVRRTIDVDGFRKLVDLLPAADPLDLGRRLSMKWLHPDEIMCSAVDLPDIVSALSGPLQGDPDYADAMMLDDQCGYLPDDLLVKVDRTSMSTGLEARVPLLDHRSVEFAWRIPWALKYRAGTQKWILKQVLRKYLPDPLIDRPKMGFQVPVKEWLRGPLEEWASGLLAPSRIARDGYFKPEVVSRIWQEHRTGKRHWHYRIWALLMFNAWLDAENDIARSIRP